MVLLTSCGRQLCADRNGSVDYVDMAFIPKRYDPSPALIVELKAGGTPEEALSQMKSRNYTSSLEGIRDQVLLVAITYCGPCSDPVPH